MRLLATIIALYFIINNPFIGLIYVIWKVVQMLKPESIKVNYPK